jgi:protein-S-isoprenylcysteine O-methyltransferase Ste14
LALQERLRKIVHWNLIKIIVVYLSVLAILVGLVQYDLAVRTPWILHPTITRILGWVTALYGLFWIVWWWFWIAIEGGQQTIELYNVTWAPVTKGFCTNGPFEWCRHPLAFGYLEFLWGLGFLVQSTTTVLKVVPALTVITLIVLWLVVERRLRRTHGSAYRRYQQQAPLFIPRIPDRAAILHVFRRRRRH